MQQISLHEPNFLPTFIFKNTNFKDGIRLNCMALEGVGWGGEGCKGAMVRVDRICEAYIRILMRNARC